jgi:hypothetical protein
MAQRNSAVAASKNVLGSTRTLIARCSAFVTTDINRAINPRTQAARATKRNIDVIGGEFLQQKMRGLISCKQNGGKHIL